MDIQEEAAMLRVLLALLIHYQHHGEARIPRAQLADDYSNYHLDLDDTDPAALIIRCKQTIELALCP